jgi:hypothetical protein
MTLCFIALQQAVLCFLQDAYSLNPALEMLEATPGPNQVRVKVCKKRNISNKNLQYLRIKV